VALDSSVNLTGVGELIVQEGGSLTLTAAQFQQLAGIGTITVLDDPNVVLETTVNITDLTQADVTYDFDGDGGTADPTDTLNMSGILVNNLHVSLAEDVVLGTFTDMDGDPATPSDVVLTSEAVLGIADFILTDGQTLSLVSPAQADGLDVDGAGTTTLKMMFDWADFWLPGGTPPDGIDASGYDVTTLKVLNTMVNSLNVETLLENLPSAVTLQIYHDPAEFGYVSATNRMVFIEAGVTVPGFMVFNDWQDDHEVRTVTLTMDGGVEIDGNLRLSTTEKDSTLIARNFSTLTIISQGTAENYEQAQAGNPGVTENVINGDITAEQGPPSPSIENNLLNVIINGDQDFYVDGDIIFNSIEEDKDTATLIINNAATTTVHGDLVVDTSDVSYEAGAYSYPGLYDYIDTLNIINNGGPLVVEGASPAIDANGELEVINLSGTGDMSFGTAAGAVGLTAESLSVLDASGLFGDLTLGVVEDIDDNDFLFTAGTGVTTMTLIDDDLDSTGTDGIPGNADDTSGWTFDFSDAAAGSEFHLDFDGTGLVNGSILTIDLGANTTLFIDETMDLSGLDLSILPNPNPTAIVLADEVTLTLTAAQADLLNIIAGEDTGAEGFTGVVNIVDLGDYNDLNENGFNDDADELVAYDFSGIHEDVAGIITLFDDDVTLHADTHLGAFALQLKANSTDDYDLSGQTIRFATVAQAQRAVVVNNDDGDGSVNSTNVVWLFTAIDNITNPDGVDTVNYDPGIGRLLFSEDLVNNEGGLVENLFTTLPSSILRVDFATLEELDILLSSEAVNRVIELSSFVDIANLTFSDDDVQPEEHIETLTIVMGGEVEVDDIAIDDVVAAADTDPASVQFNLLTIDSRVALHQDHYMATEGYINDNDGLNETGENVQPDPVNTLGNIGVGASNGVDLLDVVINTYGVAVYGSGTSVTPDYGVNDGADLSVQTLTFDSEVAGETAYLDINGDNDVTFKSIDTTDPDIAALVVDTTGHTGVFTVTGGSPALDLDNTEEMILATGANTKAYFGYKWTDADSDGIMDADEFALKENASGLPYAGVNGGDELSHIGINGAGLVHLGVIADIDGTDDDLNSDGDLSDPDENIAFTLDGNGNTTAILGKGDVNGTSTSPFLAAGSTWAFEDVNLTITDDVVFQDGAILEFENVNLVIDDDVDLSRITINWSAAIVWLFWRTNLSRCPRIKCLTSTAEVVHTPRSTSSAPVPPRWWAITLWRMHIPTATTTQPSLWVNTCGPSVWMLRVSPSTKNWITTADSACSSRMHWSTEMIRMTSMKIQLVM